MKDMDNGVKREAVIPEARAEKTVATDKARLDAIGGEPLAGSGFEKEEPEPGFSDIETSGLAPDQNQA